MNLAFGDMLQVVEARVNFMQGAAPRRHSFG